MENIIVWISRAVIFGSVVMYGAIGEMITEKSGHLNLGTPGIMCVGGAFGFVGAFLYETNAAVPNAFAAILITLCCGFFAAMLAGLIYCFLTVTLRANQNVTGLALTIFGVGLAKFVGIYIIPKGAVSTKASYTNSLFSTKIPFLSDIGWHIGDIFFSYGFMMYLAIIIAIVVSVFFNRTKTGLNLSAIGESPATADAAGINVTKYKYIAMMIGSGITGLGGVYYVMDYNYGTWATAAGDAIESLAWLSVALVIFATWKSVNAIWGSYLFGLCYWAYNYVPAILGLKLNTYLAQMLPYIVTIIVLIIGSLRKRKENQGPQSLGLSYFREAR
ncbi:MAG: ABC transporter permease [Acutalibacteraceae bacterium]